MEIPFKETRKTVDAVLEVDRIGKEAGLCILATYIEKIVQKKHVTVSLGLFGHIYYGG